MRIVINRCFGGFSLSDKAKQWLIDNKNWSVTSWLDGNYKDRDADLVDNTTTDTMPTSIFGRYSMARHDQYEDDFRNNPDLIACIDAIGPEKASGSCAQLEIVQIPDGTDYTIEEYDGLEHIAEKHRTWS